MGNTAANISQVSTTISVTNGSPTGTVSSATGIARGMVCKIDGTNSAIVQSISGTTVTFTANYSGLTNASATFRASFLGDAQSVGETGGAITITQAGSEVGQHKHPITDKDHDHDIHELLSGSGAGPGYVSSVIVNTATKTSKSFTGITETNNSTAANPMQIMQPGMVVTIFVKL